VLPKILLTNKINAYYELVILAYKYNADKFIIFFLLECQVNFSELVVYHEKSREKIS